LGLKELFACKKLSGKTRKWKGGGKKRSLRILGGKPSPAAFREKRTSAWPSEGGRKRRTKSDKKKEAEEEKKKNRQKGER